MSVMNSEPPSIERRITLRMFSYWEKIRKDRSMPHVSDVNSADLHDLWDSCFLVMLDDKGNPDPDSSYIGKSIIHAYRHGLVEGENPIIISPNIDSFLRNHMQIFDSHKPLMEEGEFENFLLGTIKYRQCVLPLGENSKLHAILGGMHFKGFLPKTKG